MISLTLPGGGILGGHGIKSVLNPPFIQKLGLPPPTPIAQVFDKKRRGSILRDQATGGLSTVLSTPDDRETLGG